MSIKIASIKTHHVELTSAIEEYIKKRIRKLDRLVDDSDTSAQLDIEIGKTVPDQNSGDIFYTKINMHVAGSYLFADANEGDLYASIDAAQEEILREVRKQKEKKETLFRRGARALKQTLTRFRPKQEE